MILVAAWPRCVLSRQQFSQAAKTFRDSVAEAQRVSTTHHLLNSPHKPRLILARKVMLPHAQYAPAGTP